MVTEIGLDRIADFARLERKRGFFKRQNHHAFAEPAKIAGIVFISRVQRVFGGQRFPAFARGEFFEDCRGFFFCFHENMARFDFFLLIDFVGLVQDVFAQLLFEDQGAKISLEEIDRERVFDEGAEVFVNFVAEFELLVDLRLRADPFAAERIERIGRGFA